MKPLFELQKLGYEVALKDDRQGISLNYKGKGKPDPNQVKPLIVEVKQRKEEAINYLKEQESDHRKEVQKLEKLLDAKGFAKVNSATLGEIVIFAKDNESAKRAPAGS